MLTFLMGGVPFLIFRSSFMILRSFCSSGLRVDSSTSTCKQRRFKIIYLPISKLLLLKIHLKNIKLQRIYFSHNPEIPYEHETHQQFVKVLNVIWLEEGQVSRRLIVDLFHRSVFCLHVEASHASNRGWSGS